MIRAVYVWCGQALYWITVPALYVIGLVARPRVRVILTDDDGRILLVRNWYGRQRWTLPGGGVKWHEPPVEAVRRELREELSLDLSEHNLQPIGTLERYENALPFQADLFATELSSETVMFRHPLELIDHRWVLPKELPQPLHPSVSRALQLRHK